MSGPALVAALAEGQPRLVTLAEELSLAARVDPPLLRRARLDLGLGVEAEARLWFSPLVGSRSVAGFTFAPAVVEELRRRLVARGGLDAAWQRTLQAHAGQPEGLRLEEELTWRGLAGHDGAQLDRLLGPAVRALRDPGRRGLELWARQVLDRAPAPVRQAPAAQVLDREASLRAAGAGPAKGADWIDRVEPTGSSETLRLRVVGSELELGMLRDAEGADHVVAPTSFPNLVELRWTDAQGPRSRVVPWGSSRLTVVADVALPLTLRFADGSGVVLRDRAQAEAVESPAVGDRGVASMLFDPANLDWAKHLQERLQDAGWRVVQQPAIGEVLVADLAGAARRPEDRLFVLLSPSFVANPVGHRALAELAAGSWEAAVLVLPNLPPLGLPETVAVVHLDPDQEGRDLDSALARLGLESTAAGPPPPLPPHLDRELEAAVFGPLMEATSESPPDVASLWAAVLPGRRPKNAALALAAYLAGARPEAWSPELDHLLARRQGSEPWQRLRVRTPDEGRAEGALRQVVIDPQRADGQSRRLLAALRDATREGQLASALEKQPHDGPPLLEEVYGPTALSITPFTPAPPLDLTSRVPLVRMVGSGEARDEVPTTGAWLHAGLGRVPLDFLLGHEPRVLHSVRDLEHALRDPVPQVLTLDLDAKVGEDRSIVELLPDLPVYGLLLLRLVITPKQGSTWLDLPYLLDGLDDYCATRGPDTVVLRVVDAEARNTLEADFLGSLASGRTVGDALLQVHGKDPYPWFCWSDPLLRVELPLDTPA